MPDRDSGTGRFRPSDSGFKAGNESRRKRGLWIAILGLGGSSSDESERSGGHAWWKKRK